MKLLFDQNLSPRLPQLLADLYPDSAHVRDFGMRDSTDTEIWEYAKGQRLCDCLQRFRLSSSEPSLRASPKIHLAAGWELSSKND